LLVEDEAAAGPPSKAELAVEVSEESGLGGLEE
jgi:hypothetical protein